MSDNRVTDFLADVERELAVAPDADPAREFLRLGDAARALLRRHERMLNGLAKPPESTGGKTGRGG